MEANLRLPKVFEQKNNECNCRYHGEQEPLTFKKIDNAFHRGEH